MDFELSDDQAALQQELRRFLETRVTSEARRAAADQPGAVDRALWRELADMGVFGLRLPEADGGVGLGLAEAAIVFEELGRVAAPGPLIATHVAASAGLVDGAASGQTVVGLLPADAHPVLVEHLDGLDTLLVVGPDAVERVDPAPRGATGHPVERPLDPLTPVHLLDAVPHGDPIGGADVVRLVQDAGLLAAAFQVGLAETAVQMGTQYAKERKQFDRPIGSFQAVKHLLADAQVSVEIARAAVHAAAVVENDARAVHGARIVASRAAHRATTACIQVHGGMGYTWELDAHLLLKRALVLDVAVPPTERSLDALAAAL
ncbi:MAG TPA: acyl-CoA dehydrogenase family protein [Acidimicrobiales bacterium]|nr:acyl-CoA dehydrogenase family protein [Acidimicrobiales bacterium]